MKNSKRTFIRHSIDYLLVLCLVFVAFQQAGCHTVTETDTDPQTGQTTETKYLEFTPKARETGDKVVEIGGAVADTAKPYTPEPWRSWLELLGTAALLWQTVSKARIKLGAKIAGKTIRTRLLNGGDNDAEVRTELKTAEMASIIKPIMPDKL